MAGHVYGVEIIPEAIEDAGANAKYNGIDNATFYTGKAEEIGLSDAKITLPKPDVIVIDPPRKGCDEALINTILSTAPKRVVYVSCDPATLSRDLKLLTDGGYEIKEATPVDMFPQCVHCECAVSLVRK